ncbi:MAG: hypothetical protein DMG81_19965 [Acidobacteria bacterium]|nr:MAG: hypothetical protein DMG81_19965 [Acidobacteriota bacterium]
MIFDSKVCSGKFRETGKHRHCTTAHIAAWRELRPGHGCPIPSDTPRDPKEKIMAMSMAGSGASAPQMNVTPLIDVLLVLIIIFMVIVAQSKEKGFKTEIPQPPANPESAVPPVRTIVVQLRPAKGNELPDLKINQQPVSWPDLKSQLQDILRIRGLCHRYRARRGSGPRGTVTERNGLRPLNVKFNASAATQLLSHEAPSTTTGPSRILSERSGSLTCNRLNSE